MAIRRCPNNPAGHCESAAVRSALQERKAQCPADSSFAVASRLLIGEPNHALFRSADHPAGALLILLFAQLGLPENTLYKYGGLLGPQSTPLTLGGSQLVVAVETLRVQ